MILSTVDARPIQCALYKGATWFNWQTSTQAVPVWESTFNAANHLRALVADKTYPQLQWVSVDNYAVIASDSLVVFTGGAPISTIDCPPNLYIGPYPGVFTLK